MLAEEGDVVTFTTIGGGTIKFVHEGGPYGYGEWNCRGCRMGGRDRIADVNAHAGSCRAN